MATKGISIQASRFALLNIEDDEDADQKTSKSKQQGSKNQSGQKSNQNQNANTKKKNKKKKKQEAAAENAELRNLAFGSSKSGGNRQRTLSASKSGGESVLEVKQWDEWKKIDTESTAVVYEQELEQALLLSKLEFEKTKENGVSPDESGDKNTSSSSKEKKKKKKEKAPMSLEQFNQLKEQEKHDSDEELIEFMPAAGPADTNVDNPDPAFFNQVNDDVSRILRQEKMQEDYRRQYSAESVQTLHHQEELEKRDQEIERLTAENTRLEEAFKQVKKRNQQLFHILSHGEMKEKKDLLLELEQLRQVQQELTVEVSSLTTDLEKERSTVSGLKDELNKAKAGKHGAR